MQPVRLAWVLPALALALLPRCIRWEDKETSDLSPCWGLPCGECQSNTTCGWDALDTVCRARNQFPDGREATRARCAMTPDAGTADRPATVDVVRVDVVDPDAPAVPLARVRILNASTRGGGLDACFVRDGSASPAEPLVAHAGRAIGIERGWRSTPLPIGEPGAYRVIVVAAGQPCDVATPLHTASFTFAAASTYTLVVHGSAPLSALALDPGADDPRVALRLVNALPSAVNLSLDAPPESPVERWPDVAAGELARRADTDAAGYTFVATTSAPRNFIVRQGSTRIASNVRIIDLSAALRWTLVVAGTPGASTPDDQPHVLRVDERIASEAAVTVPARL